MSAYDHLLDDQDMSLPTGPGLPLPGWLRLHAELTDDIGRKGRVTYLSFPTGNTSRFVRVGARVVFADGSSHELDYSPEGFLGVWRPRDATAHERLLDE